VKRTIAASAAAVTCLGLGGPAYASGLFVSERGVRPLGRGGAFVAGGDDLGAIAYNPAGIFDAGASLLIDGAVVIYQSQYTRQSLLRQVDPNTGEVVATYEQTFPTVDGSSAPLPLPTLAGSFIVHPDWRVAIGAYAPYGTLPSYPAELEDESPAPQRYSLISLDGTALIVLGGYAAWRPIEPLTLGIGVELLLGQFQARKALTACVPERFFCAPEDPRWDALNEIKAAPIVTPSGSLGLTWEFYEGWRLGTSFHLPFWIIAPATVKTRLPSTPLFRTVEQKGDSATLEFQIPWVVRLGLEMRDVAPGLRVEVGVDYHHWAMHDAISLSSGDIALTNVPGFPEEYILPDLSIARGFQSVLGARIGAEYAIDASDAVTVTPRLGFSYETSAIPTEYLSVLSLDAGKATPSAGLGITVDDKARFDLVYAHQFYPEVVVAPEEARLEQTYPLKANPAQRPDYINGGTYNWTADIVGIGFSYTFDDGKAAAVEEEAPLPTPKPQKKEEKEQEEGEQGSEPAEGG
jgi:long-chain fatty acid transport protein